MFPMFLIQVIIVLVVFGLALWILQQIPMDPTIARIIRVVVIVCVCLWLLYILIGFMPAAGLPMRR
jgi:uncharacterized membrane protein YhaH (DUF805 family)